MKTTFIAATAALAATALAGPVEKRQSTNIDGVVLNFALTLEQLESAFYQQGLARFSAGALAAAGFTDTPFYKNLQHVSKDEATHVAVLTAALNAAGVQPVAPCTYDFGFSTPEKFIQTASLLEGVGVAAYAGAAQLITNKQYLTEAATILSVEARHNAFLRNSLNQSPFPQPFDPALDVNEVYSLAAQFIKSCPPSNPKLPVKAFPLMELAGSQIVYARGSQTKFNVAPSVNLNQDLYIAYPLVSGNIFVKAFKTGPHQVRAVVPKGEFGPAGQAFAILVNSPNTLTDATTVAGPAVVSILSPYLGGN